MKQLLIAVCAAVALGTSAQNPWENPNASKVVLDSIHSEILGAWRQYNVYLPENFNVDTNKQYPVLYLLHGLNDNHLGWDGALYTALPYINRNFTK